MGPLAVFGITNDGLNLAVNLVLLFFVVLWLALVWWTYADARRRIADPMIVACATAASLFPYLGTVVYLIVRPPEYLEDVRERELEIAAAEARLAGAEQHACPYCSYEIEKSFLRCPHCMNRLKEACAVCAKPLDPRWKICPYCEAEVGANAPQQGRRERPRRRERTAVTEAPTQTAQTDAPPRRAAARAPREEGAPRPREAPPQGAPRPREAPPQGAPRPREAPPQGAPRQQAAAQPTETSRQARPSGQAERPAGDAPRERPTGDRARPSS